jgi:hypothetical protein
MKLLFRNFVSLLALICISFSATAQTTDTGLAADAAVLPTEQTTVSVGLYVLRLNKVSPRDGSFDVDMWLWFRWLGTDIRPEQTFELANGVITNRTLSDITIDGGMNYTTVRVQGTIFHDYDVRRFPLDDHVINIEIEDANLEDRLLTYQVDEGTALDPSVEVAGWQVGLEPATVETHTYSTTYGLRDSGTAASVYSRFSVPITLTRMSYGPLFKAFWISLLSVVLGLLAFLIKSDDLDARFGMGVGSIFAASANAFVIADSLPQTTAVTLAEQINLIAVGVIFTSVFISIWSLRLRYAGRDEDSLRLDRKAMFTLGSLYLALNVLVMSVDLSGYL